MDSLTRDDFDASPVWEYASDEEGVEDWDETWVRPVFGAMVPTPSYAIVAADFEAAGGRGFEGYAFVSTLDGEPEACQAVIWHDDRGLFVANPEAVFSERFRSDRIAELGLDERDVFPVSFRLRVPIAGRPGPWNGSLP